MRSRHELVLAFLLAAAACTRMGVPTTEPHSVLPWPAALAPGALSGVTTLGAQRLRVFVELVTDEGGEGTAHLEIPDLPLTAFGSAAWRGDTLELDLRYDGPCPGDVRIRAERAGDGSRVEGTLTASDCTGEESGTVVLEVANGRPATSVPAPR